MTWPRASATPSPIGRSATRTTGRVLRRRWRCSARRVRMTLTIPGALPGRPDRAVRVRQVHVRAQALHADRSDVVRWLPRARVGRRERPVGNGRRVRGAALRRRAAPGSRQADGRRRDQRPAGGAQAARRARAASITCCRSRSSSICRSASATSGIDRDPIATSVRTSFATSGASCIVRFAASDAKASGTCTCSSRRKKSTPPSSSGSRCGTTASAKHGPFDIIGDVHGCCDELESCCSSSATRRNDGGPWAHPAGRKAIFVGDLVDRGPRIVDTLKMVMAMSQAGTGAVRPRQPRHQAEAEARGPRRQVTHGLDRIARASSNRRHRSSAPRSQEFLDGLVSHYVFDDGRLVVAHAGMKEEMQGRGSAKVRDFALFGETTGETDEFGLPVRYNWAAEYRGRPAWSTATRLCPSRSGSIARSTSTPAACSAAD